MYGVLDSKNSGTSEATVVLLNGQSNPNGIAWHNGSLYVAQTDRITRYDNADAHVIANMVRHASPVQNAHTSKHQSATCLLHARLFLLMPGEHHV